MQSRFQSVVWLKSDRLVLGVPQLVIDFGHSHILGLRAVHEQTLCTNAIILKDDF